MPSPNHIDKQKAPLSTMELFLKWEKTDHYKNVRSLAKKNRIEEMLCLAKNFLTFKKNRPLCSSILTTKNYENNNSIRN